jgi:hypothetical protein
LCPGDGQSMAKRKKRFFSGKLSRFVDFILFAV